MKKFIKAALWGAGGLALLMAGAALALKLYFTQARLKALVTEFAARNLGRQLTFDSVSLNLSGLSITGLKVSEYPDFRKGEFFTASSFSVLPSFRALLRGEVKINSVSASGLDMRVAEVRKDTYNFSDLLASRPAAAARPAPKAAAPQRRLSVSSLKVRGSRFSYRGADGMAVTLRDINLSASGISPDGMFPVEGDFTLDVASPYLTASMPARLKGRLSLGGFDPAKGKAEIDKASLQLGGVKAEFRGSLAGLLEPDAKLKLNVKPFSTADLRPVFKGLPARILLPEIDADADLKLTARDVKLRSVKLMAGPVRAAIKGRAAWNPAVTYDIEAAVKAQVPEIDTTLLARKARQYPVPPGLKLPLSDLSADVRLKDGYADVRAFSLRSGPLDADGRAGVAFSGPGLKASGRAKAAVKDLGRAAAIAPAKLGAYALSGSASADAEFSWDGKAAARGRAALNGAGASFAGHKLSALSGVVDFTMDSASSKKLEGKLDGEALQASFSARSVTTHPKAEFDVKLAKLLLKETPASGAAAGPDAGEKAAAAAPFYADVSGRVELGGIEHPNFSCGPASLKLALVNASADLGALDGSASFTAGPGKFSELYVLAGKNKAAKVALYPLLVLQKASGAVKGLGLPDFNDIAFDRIEGDYAFSRGTMKINKSSLVSDVADASSGGLVNLPAGRLDMRVETRMKKASGVTMTAPVAFTVKGTFDSPSVKPDIRSIAAQPAVQKAAEKLAPGAAKLLKGLLGK